MTIEETAQDAYKQLMRDHIAPGVRALGFTGSAGRFWLPDPENWVGIGFQRSPHSDRNEIRFTINLSVISRADWDDLRTKWDGLEERPSAGAFPVGWSNRIGSFLPQRKDYWWMLVPGQDLAGLAFDVMTAIQMYGLPALREQLRQQGSVASPHTPGDIAEH